jgi:6-phosphogluconolactonase
MRAAGLFLLLLGLGPCLASAASNPAPMQLLIGTYTGGDGRGILSVAFDPATGRFGASVLAVEAANPSFLIWHPAGHTLYAVHELGHFAGAPGGAVSAFRPGADGATLTLLGTEPTGGAHPCHLALSPDRAWLFVANYSGGNVAVYPVSEDGGLGPRIQLHAHAGRGPHATRQERPHAHGVTFTPDGQTALVVDLGIDQIVVYRRATDGAGWAPDSAAATHLAPGAGPRHAAFHPNGRWLYVVNELDNTVTRLDWDPAAGTLVVRESVPTLPPDWSGANTTAEIAVHPDGQRLFASNRGHDSIAVFALEPDRGGLAPLGHLPTGGSAPRHFALSPDGDWLIVANQDARSLVSFRVPPAGLPQRVAELPDLPGRPVCVLFPPVGR